MKKAVILSVCFMLLSFSSDYHRTLAHENVNEILTVNEMSLLVGGATSGGGTCEPYKASCDSRCESFASNQCSGGASGNCDNEYFSPVCRCDGGYVYVAACLD